MMSQIVFRLATGLTLIALVLVLLVFLAGKTIPSDIIALNLNSSPDSTRNSTRHLALMDINRLVLIRLSGESASRPLPVWSPDGRQLAYITANGAAIFNFESGATRLLNDYGTIGSLAWSPDSQQIAMESVGINASAAGWSNGITILNLLDSQAYHFAAQSDNFQWIPGQQHLVLVHQYLDDTNRDREDFQIIDNKAGAVNQFTEIQLMTNLDFSISPDGQAIAIAAAPVQIGRPSFGYSIYAINLNDSHSSLLTAFGQDDIGNRFPIWSPDGKRIAYWSSGEIFVMNADGSDPRQITHSAHTTEAAAPVWSPDSQHILFSQNDGQTRTLYVTDADGQQTRSLVSSASSSFDWEAAWQP